MFSIAPFELLEIDSTTTCGLKKIHEKTIHIIKKVDHIKDILHLTRLYVLFFNLFNMYN